ncbi:MAG: hypothetical protein LUF30_09950 [Lachnospiraceae bacterium]|nr:hypothetical protein [Lachnospiraceae bacterium]
MVVLDMGFPGMVAAKYAADVGAGVLIVGKMSEAQAGGNSKVCGQCVAVDFMKNDRLKNILEQIDWELFLKQKEWLYSQQCYLERWHGTETAALPEEILNLMDCLQDAWEEKEGSEDSKGSQFSGKQVDVENSYWYKEVWTDEDLVNALENAEIDVTEDNVEKIKQ